MTDTIHLKLPFLAPTQAQKDVTVNEALRLLDGLIQLSVLSIGDTVPPVTPVEGDRYLIGAGAAGVWAGWDGTIGYFADGAWIQLVPAAGWRLFDEITGDLLLFDGIAWATVMQRSATTMLASGQNGASTSMMVVEDLLLALSGPTVDSSITIPAGAILLGVSSRVVTAIGGATAVDIGTAGDPVKFGAGLTVAADDTHVGEVTPELITVDTPLRLTAGGGDFTSGAVRLAIHYIALEAPMN